MSDKTLSIIHIFGDDRMPNDTRIEQHGILKAHAEKMARYCYRNQRMLLLRCPNESAVKYHAANPCGWDDTISPKPIFEKNKTGGELTTNGFYSDYDILSMWKYSPNGYQFIYLGSEKAQEVQTKPGPELQKLVAEYMMKLSTELLSLATATGIYFQHGSNDEYLKKDATGKLVPGQPLEDKEKFIAFTEKGQIHFIDSKSQLKGFYQENKLKWIYG